MAKMSRRQLREMILESIDENLPMDENLSEAVHKYKFTVTIMSPVPLEEGDMDLRALLDTSASAAANRMGEELKRGERVAVYHKDPAVKKIR